MDNNWEMNWKIKLSMKLLKNHWLCCRCGDFHRYVNHPKNSKCPRQTVQEAIDRFMEIEPFNSKKRNEGWVNALNNLKKVLKESLTND